MGIDTTSIELDPKSGQLSFFLERVIDPLQTRRTVGQDDSQWAAISGPILQACRAIDVKISFAPPVNSPTEPVPWWVIGHFYQEPQQLTLSGMLRRHEEISRDQNFKPLDPTRLAGLIKSRSEDALQNQKALLGDIRNRHQAGEALKRLATSLENGGPPVEQIQAQLQQTLQLSADGTYWPTGIGDSNEISLQQMLKDHGWDIPTHHDQVANLANALTTASPKAAILGDLGGALSWPTPLDQDSQEQLRAAIRAGKFGKIPLSSHTHVLDYLLNGRQLTAQEPLDPRRLIDEWVHSPRGLELGKALEAEFAARSVKGSAADWLLAALSVGSEAGPGDATTIEGYPLVSAANSDKPASAVVKALTAHLLTTGKASCAETASVQTHLMLASRAPEFLVKGIPQAVTVGSHSWVSFTTAVARIEAKAPGATAIMNYAQIMLAAGIAPITDDERQVEYAAQTQAIKAWAVPNGMDYPTTDATLSEVRRAFDAQVRELGEAASTPDIDQPTTHVIGLEHLKAAFPTIDPKLFEQKSITSQPSNRHFPGPYSLLDLYIDGRALVGAPPDSNSDWGNVGRGLFIGLTLGQIDVPADGTPAVWVSTSDQLKINEMLAKIKDLPRPLAQFDAQYPQYENAVKTTTSAQLKHLISKLPLEDRQNLEFGKITVRREVGYDRPDQPLRTEEGVLLVETERTLNGERSVMTYAIDRLKGTVTRRPGKTYKEKAPTEGWYPARGKRYDSIKPGGQYPSGITDESLGAHGVPKSFSSARTQYLVDAMLEDMDLPAVHRYARGTTTYDTEVPTYQIVQEVALNLIPFRSAIQNFKEGKVTDGVVDLAFDIFGFAVGLGTAAKGAKGALAGASALSKAGQVFKIVGRAAVGALNPLGGIDDLARGVARGVRAGTVAAYKGVQHLRGSYRSVNLLELAKKANIAEGTFRTANGARSSKSLAQFDEATQQWFDFDPRTNKTFGKLRENFVPDPPQPGVHNNLHAIASDDVLRTASQQHGLAATGTFKVGQETVEGPMVMFQGNWHQYDVVKKRAAGLPLKDVELNRIAASGEVRSLDNLQGYEAKYIALDALSPQGLQGNVYVGGSKKEYIKVDDRLYESQVKDGQRIILHPTDAGLDVPVKDLGASGWVPVTRAERLLGGAGSAPVHWNYGNGIFTVPMDDIKLTKNLDAPFSLNYQGVDRNVTFNSVAGAWTEHRTVKDGDKIYASYSYYWRTGKAKWQRGTFAEFSNATKLESKTYKLADIATPLVVNIPKNLKPVPAQLHYFWAGQEMPSHLIDNLAKNATQAPGYRSILHVDADNPAIFQQIKANLQSKVPTVTVVNLHEDEAFKQVKNSEMYTYFRQGQGKNLAAASDVARYPIMHKHGGVYLDTDDLIRSKISAKSLEAGADDVLLGPPNVHKVTDYKTFYNTSNFATRPGNPVLENMITEMNKRFTENKAYFVANRPTVTRGADGNVIYTPEFLDYEKKIFDTVGPNTFNNVLKSKRPDMYDLGIDGLTRQAEVIERKLVAKGETVDVITAVREAYKRNGISPPELLVKQIEAMKEHYFPLRYQFNIKVGGEHSWIGT